MSAAISTPAAAFLEATVRTATPLLFAALGELVVERAGVINIGLEGVMLCGAYAAFATAGAFGPTGGMVAALIAGIGVGALFALVAVWLRGDQIVSGMAITLLGLGITGALYRTGAGASTLATTVSITGPVGVPGLDRIPLIGRALFDQPMITYASYLLPGALWWWMYRTHAGIALRATGELPAAAEAAGISPTRIRVGAVLFGGAMGGVAGGTLVLAQAGTFVEGMSAGRGFIAIAIVVLGRWQPAGVAIAALVFGGASALQYLAQSLGYALPYQLFLAFPYVLTLAALAGLGGRATPPAALGRVD